MQITTAAPTVVDGLKAVGQNQVKAHHYLKDHMNHMIAALYHILVSLNPFEGHLVLKEVTCLAAPEAICPINIKCMLWPFLGPIFTEGLPTSC